MKSSVFGYNRIHQIVENNPDAFWDGWTAVFVDRKRHGMMNKHGIWHNGKWSTCHRISPNNNGKWVVPAKYV